MIFYFSTDFFTSTWSCSESQSQVGFLEYWVISDNLNKTLRSKIRETCVYLIKIIFESAVPHYSILAQIAEQGVGFYLHLILESDLIEAELVPSKNRIFQKKRPVRVCSQEWHTTRKGKV